MIVPFPETNHGICRVYEKPAEVTRMPRLWAISFINGNGSYAICPVIAETVQVARIMFGLQHPDYVEILEESRI